MCLDCGFYKGRLVVDMSAKTKAREERLQAKKDMIKEQKGETEAEGVESIPGEEAPIEEVPARKAKDTETPELAQVKTATPRKGQAS
jgi:hypothetical protein